MRRLLSLGGTGCVVFAAFLLDATAGLLVAGVAALYVEWRWRR